MVSFFLSGIFWYLFGIAPMEGHAKLIYFILACGFILLGIIFIFLYFYLKERKNVKDLQEQIKVWGNTTYHINASGDVAFEEMPIGIVVYDDNKLIKWFNNYMQDIVQAKLNDSPLTTISGDILNRIESNQEKFLVKIGENVYDCVHYKENKLLYFFDVTSREELKQKYQNRTLAMGIVVVDNLEESLKRYDLQGKTTISGQILGKISNYFESFNCFFQTVDDDRMIFICDRYDLNRMIDDKFSILNGIREISKSAHLKTTISIGAACFDSKGSEFVGKVNGAVELAEKRGGDQAVVNIQNESIRYIGGELNALEKNTLVTARMQTTALRDISLNASNVIIMAHKAADCDALGAMIGALRLVQSFGVKDVKIVLERKYLDVTAKRAYDALIEMDPDFEDELITEEKALFEMGEDTLLLICDTQAPKLVMFDEVLKRASHLAIIDHHRVGDVDFEHVEMSYVETYSSSTVELISEMLIFSSQTKINAVEATIMLSGIIVDTNNFTYRSGSRTFEAASTLKELGADMVKVRKLLRDSYDAEKEMAEALLNAKIYFNRFAIVTIDKENMSDRTLLARISERLLTVEGIDAAFTIANMTDGTVSVSSRSLEGVNVQIIMEELGGGGHLQQAACQLKDKNIEEVKELILNILKRDYGYEGEEKMKVILTVDVKGKGKKDDIIEVNNGYGNYLINNNMGLLANEANLKKLAENQKQAALDETNRINLLNKLKSEIDGKSVTIYLKVGADGKAFGHVTSKLICDEFEAQNGIRLDKKKLELPSDINAIGIYTANIVLDKGIVASFQVNVIGN